MVEAKLDVWNEKAVAAISGKLLGLPLFASKAVTVSITDSNMIMVIIESMHYGVL
jgi:hypothetical protein